MLYAYILAAVQWLRSNFAVYWLATSTAAWGSTDAQRKEAREIAAQIALTGGIICYRLGTRFA